MDTPLPAPVEPRVVMEHRLDHIDQRCVDSGTRVREPRQHPRGVAEQTGQRDRIDALEPQNAERATESIAHRIAAAPPRPGPRLTTQLRQCLLDHAQVAVERRRCAVDGGHQRREVGIVCHDDEMGLLADTHVQPTPYGTCQEQGRHPAAGVGWITTAQGVSRCAR